VRNILFKIIEKILRWHQQEQYRRLTEKYHINKFFRFNGKNIYFYGDGELDIK